MSRLRPTTLRGRLLLSLAAMLVPLAVVAAAGLAGHARAVRQFDALGTEAVQDARRIAAARDALYALQGTAAMDADGVAGAALPLRRADRLVDRRLAVLRRADEPGERALAADVVERVAAARAARRRGSHTGVQLALGEAQATLGALQAEALGELEGESRALHRAERRHLAILAGLLGLVTLGALAVARRTSTSLQRPLLALRRAARRLGDGDLAHRVELRGDDELRDVGVAFNLMAERLVESRRQLLHQAFHDELTGLPNRALLGDRAARALARDHDTGRRHVAALFLDLDDFKGVNDSLGHNAGDALLREVAARLRSALRPQDTIARLGGDEFAVLLEDLAEPGDAVHAAERILLALGPPIPLGGREHHVRASVGVAVAEAGASADDLLRNADVAMYQVKGSGKGGFRSFEGWMHADAVERLELEEELRAAIERHELQLQYQPVLDLRTGEVTGAEALARWLHPRHGLVSPGEFIPLAEQTGLIVPLGRWVVEAACARLRLLEDAGLVADDFAMGVNVSPGQFLDAGFVGHVDATLRRHGLAPSRLVVEITEGLLMGDVATSVVKLGALKALGVRVALDDFGTGYSSLGYLRQFPVDVLKIDRAFVEGVAGEGGDRKLVEAVVGLGRTLGLLTVAEGVEHAEQRLALQALGCDRGQGFHFARPVGADALSQFLAERPPVPAGR